MRLLSQHSHWECLLMLPSRFAGLQVMPRERRVATEGPAWCASNCVLAAHALCFQGTPSMTLTGSGDFHTHHSCALHCWPERPNGCRCAPPDKSSACSGMGYLKDPSIQAKHCRCHFNLLLLSVSSKTELGALWMMSQLISLTHGTFLALTTAQKSAQPCIYFLHPPKDSIPIMGP